MENSESHTYNIPQSEENSKYLLEIYKTYVETSQKTSDRRSQISQFFVTLNTFILGGLGAIVLNFKFENELKFLVLGVILIMPGIIGALLSQFWIMQIKSYSQLNNGKFKVIHELENLLPVGIRPFEKEWEILKQGKSKEVYHSITNIESYTPMLFLGVYAIIILVGFCLLCKQIKVF